MPADLPTGDGMATQPLHRHLRRIIEVSPARTLGAFLTSGILAPLAEAETAFHTGRETADARGAVPDRPLDRRQGARLSNAGEAGDGIRRRRLVSTTRTCRFRSAAERRQRSMATDSSAARHGLMASIHPAEVKIQGTLGPGGPRFGRASRATQPGIAPCMARSASSYGAAWQDVIWIDPKEDLFTVFHDAGAGQRDNHRSSCGTWCMRGGGGKNQKLIVAPPSITMVGRSEAPAAG